MMGEKAVEHARMDEVGIPWHQAGSRCLSTLAPQKFEVF